MPRLSAIAVALLLVGCDPPVQGPPNIIVVSMDTLRPDRLGAYGNGDGLSPNIDRFAAESVVFEDAWAVSNETLYSHAALFTSRYATETGPIFETFRLDDEPPTLASVLGVYDYQTAGFTGGGHMSPSFGLGRGFDHFERSANWGSLYHSVPQALAWFDQRDSDRPSFLFVHGYDTHHRYIKPGPWGFSRVDASFRGTGSDVIRDTLGTLRVIDGWFFPRHAPDELLDARALRIRGKAERHRIERMAHKKNTAARKLDDADLDFVRGVYDGAVSYGDTWFGLFLAALEQRGALDNSVIVLLSDHGEELGENGIFHHRYSLSDESLKVPLVVRLPGGQGGGRRVPGLVDLTDVMPTLLEAAEAESPTGIRGRSLWSVLQGGAHEPRPAVYAQTMFRGVSVRTDQGRLSFTGIGADSPYLVDMVGTARLDGPSFDLDPDLDKAQHQAMRSDLTTWATGLHHPDAAGEVKLSDEQLEVMRDKGYWVAE